MMRGCGMTVCLTLSSNYQSGDNWKFQVGHFLVSRTGDVGCTEKLVQGTGVFAHENPLTMWMALDSRTVAMEVGIC